MKKHILIGLAAVILGGSMVSCEDFLEKQPLDSVSTSNFWHTKKDAEKALTAVYSSFRNSTFSAVPAGGPCTEQEVLSDNAVTRAAHSAIQQGGITPSTGGILNDMWTDSYKGIAAANYYLDNCERVRDLYTESEFNKMKAEALFVRAFFYNELVVHYGDVPLMLHVAKVGDGFDVMPRTERAQVVRQIMEDIDFAMEWLPDIAYTDGHAVFGSALMLKCRVLLNDRKYAEVAELAGEYIHSGSNPFRLADDYAGIFFGKQIGNPEIMFSIQFTAPDDFHALDQMVGSRMTVFPSYNLRAAYEDGDPRIKMTMYELGDPWVNNDKSGKFEDDGNRAEGLVPFTGMAFKKYLDTNCFVPKASTLSDQHIVKMRYADLLLMYAEAMFESGHGADPRALKALNDVRQRPGVEMPAKTELTREIIRNERRVELAYEGIRYYDIIRWDIAKDVIPTVQYDVAGSKRKFDGNLWPVPQAQMDIMGDIWTQNAPWN
ncbi:RagB/SusD family nutrient uptake outer membrane protein [uncultured Duncaniella sp.]|uniref:RagB/SusD family nutrient uptake outer membrane protein n=1 Tax=uncultured Duncaniella sp. TaxID=2768039 RepID=UPI0023BD89D9|nr:RagB/SusD family nutrient uptake outer membrane protein [uncultured Duncaniella sp.]MDE5666254.1 RagB/SusD family nutrient uptake outer membrane protein [Duncaniella sp.]MDE5954795.1 RagB/SusD family nutrient uptake outer membrane protein [Duncaniella sp.]